MDGIACGLYINAESGGSVLNAPASAKAYYCVNQSLLRYAVEKADEVIVDGGEVNVCWRFVEVCVCVGVARVWE